MVAGVLLLCGSGWLVLRQAQGRSKRAACTNALRQMNDAFLGFARSDGRLPQAARLHQAKPFDWVFWQADRQLTRSAIAPFYQPFRAEAMRCPLDLDFSLRPFQYSYTMN